MQRQLDEEIEKMARTFWLSFDGINDYNLPQAIIKALGNGIAKRLSERNTQD